MTVRYQMLRTELLKGTGTCSPGREKEIKILQKQNPSLTLYSCSLTPLAVPPAVLTKPYTSYSCEGNTDNPVPSLLQIPFRLWISPCRVPGL